MAEKKTTAKKKTTKKAKDNKIIKEVAESIIKKEEFEEAAKETVDQDPPLTNLDAEIEGVDEANLNAMRNEWEVKSEPEYTPTVEEVEKAIDSWIFSERDRKIMKRKWKLWNLIPNYG